MDDSDDRTRGTARIRQQSVAGRVNRVAVKRRDFLRFAVVLGGGVATGSFSGCSSIASPSARQAIPQREGKAERVARRAELAAQRELYATDLRLPNARRVKKVPPSEAFPNDYLAANLRIDGQSAANALAFAERPTAPFRCRDDWRKTFVNLPVPSRASDYRSDESFCMQRLAGANSAELVNARALAYDLLDRVPVDDADLESALAWATQRATQRHAQAQRSDGVRKRTYRRSHAARLEQALDRGQLFVADFSSHAEIATVDTRYLGAPTAIFYSDPISGLLPLAIAVENDQRNCTIRLPYDGLDWEWAKLVVQAADAFRIEVTKHMPQLHLVLEPIWLAAVHQLAARHPVRVLLRPHCDLTLAINNWGDLYLFNQGGVVDSLFPATHDAVRREVIRALSEYQSRFSDFAFDRDIARRGVGSSELPCAYPWRDDGERIWHAVGAYVGDYLRAYYRDDLEVASDYELQAFLGVLRTPASSGGHGFHSLPEVASIAQLTRFLTQVIFLAGPEHSAAATTLRSEAMFPPNFPFSLRRPPTRALGATEQDLLSSLPGTSRPEELALTFGQIRAVRYLTEQIDPKPLGDYGINDFADPRAVAALDRFRIELARVEERIRGLNRERSSPFAAMLPSGIRNSASI